MTREPYPAAVPCRINKTVFVYLLLILIASIALVHSPVEASQPSDTYDALIAAILFNSLASPNFPNLYNLNQTYYYPQATSIYQRNATSSDGISLLNTLSAAYYNPSLAFYLSLLPSANPSSSLLNRSSASSLSANGSFSPVNQFSTNPLSANLLSVNLPSSQTNLQLLNRSRSSSLQGGYSLSPISNNPILGSNGIDFLNPALASTRASSANFFNPAITGTPLYGLGANVLNSPFAPLAPFTPFFAGALAAQPYATINGRLINWATPGTRRIAAVASLVLANPTYGMYCWDPVFWSDAGFQVKIWGPNKPVRAQSFDDRGFLLDAIPTFSVEPTGQVGTMTLLRADVHLYEGLINAAGAADYLTTVTVDTASTLAVTHRRNATCDVCHPTPPGHIANPATWGNCNSCHVLADVIHVHAYNAYIDIGDCYQCHPTECLSGFHGQRGIWCTNCHGNLADAVNGQMKVTGQLGKPYCADCHDQKHSENLPLLYMDSVGHGGVWCINCHGATHVEYVRPFGYQPLGYNNCESCHMVQAAVSWMGPNCGICHGSSVSPHLVDR